MGGFYHLSVDVIGRGKGRSAVACAAYRSGTKLEDLRYGKVHDYSPRRGILENGIEAPEGAPDWVYDRERLWNQLEAIEKRKDAQLAREFELALPHQLTSDQQKEILQEFISQELTPRGLVADWAIHAPNRAGDDRNHHAHVMTTLRGVSEEGFDAMKDRSLNKPEQLQEWREAWADIQNRAFERHGVRGSNGEILRVDHRSYEAQGLDQEPTQHMGVHAMAMERRGVMTDAGQRNRDILQVNETMHLPVRRQAATSFDEALRERLRAAEEEERQRQAQDHSPDM